MAIVIGADGDAFGPGQAVRTPRKVVGGATWGRPGAEVGAIKVGAIKVGAIKVGAWGGRAAP